MCEISFVPLDRSDHRCRLFVLKILIRWQFRSLSTTFVELVRVYAKKLSNRQHKLPSVLSNWVLAKILKLFSIIQIYIIISKSQVSFIEVFYSSQYDEALSAFQGPWHILRYFNRVQLIGSQFTARSFWSRICVKSPLFLSTDQITDADSLSSKS